MPGRFETRLGEGPPLVGDGGMGSLITAAVPRLRSPEEANLRAPDAVVSLHLSFIEAGAEVIETNTFSANRRKLATHYLEEELEQINSLGVKLARDAREVSGRDVFIAGSIGPIGEAATSAVRHELFTEQAALLEGRGADLFMLETFYDLDELVDAVAALRTISKLPIVALLTFDEGAETLAGVTAREAADRLAELELAAIGANHGAGLMAALEALEQMRGDGRALAALPNIGLASLSGGRVIYPHATPDYFAEFAAHARDLGARLIGGCCGTTPTEIAAIRAAIEENRQPRSRLEVNEHELVASLGEEQRETEFSRALAEGEFVVSVQLDPPLGGSNRGLLEVAQTLEESGRVRFVDVNDNATARAGMSALMVSGAIERATGLETVAHVTTRDSTILGLESMLLGAHAEGVRNILAVTGDPPEVGDYPGSRGVYELDAIGLTRLITGLNRGEDFNGRPIDAPTVLPRRRRGQPDCRRSGARGRALPREARRGGQVRDDADRLRRRCTRPVRRRDRRLADPRARRDLPAHEPPAGAAAAQRGARDRRAAGAAGRARGGRRGRRRGRDGTRARAGRRRPWTLRRRLHRGAVPPPDHRARPARRLESTCSAVRDRAGRAPGSRSGCSAGRSARRSRSAA